MTADSIETNCLIIKQKSKPSSITGINKTISLSTSTNPLIYFQIKSMSDLKNKNLKFVIIGVTYFVVKEWWYFYFSECFREWIKILNCITFLLFYYQSEFRFFKFFHGLLYFIFFHFRQEFTFSFVGFYT